MYAPRYGNPDKETELVWVNRAGVIEEIDTLSVGIPRLQLSPDNSRLALAHRVGSDIQISVYDMARKVMDSVVATMRQETIGMPMWSRPDGSRLLFSHSGVREASIVSTVVGANAPEMELLSTAGSWVFPHSLTNDGRRLAFHVDPGAGIGISVLEFTDDGSHGEAEMFLSGPDYECCPAFSPDGRWMAYVSDESGVEEVYVIRYPSGEDRQRISPSGGYAPLWSPNGTEVFYQGNWGREFWAVPIVTEPELEVGDAEMLFTGSFHASNDAGHGYDVSADGQRFLMVRLEENDWRVSELIVVQNWLSELQAFFPIDE